VITSDFARTLTPNSGEGTDHAWGGNYFIMGGAVNGGIIHGEYPSDLTDDGPLSIGRGRLIPSMSWESVLNPIAQWMGVQTEQELNYCLPNRITTGTKLIQKEEVFVA
jgi:cullin-associated NEDD8-dissociated protein 1